MIEVKSSAIKAIDFNEGLVVKFNNDTIYKYKDVPKTVFDEMLNAESKGRYFINTVQGRYVGVREV